MLRRYRLLRQADAEPTRIVSRYDRLRAGLGFQFFESYETAVHQAMRFPDAGTSVEHKRLRQLGLQMRRVRVEGFPHDIVTTVVDEYLVIAAVAHHKRRPGYWFSRLAKARQ